MSFLANRKVPSRDVALGVVFIDPLHAHLTGDSTMLEFDHGKTREERRSLRVRRAIFFNPITVMHYSTFKYEPHINYISEIIYRYFHTVIAVISYGTLFISRKGYNSPVYRKGGMESLSAKRSILPP